MSINSTNGERTQGSRFSIDELTAMNPDSQAPQHRFVWPNERIREVLGAMLTDPSLTPCLSFIKPDHFVDDSHKLIYRRLVAHVEQYKVLPTRAWLDAELNRELKERDEAVRLHYRGELSTIFEYYQNHPCVEAIRDSLQDFAIAHGTLGTLHKLADTVQKGKATHDVVTDLFRSQIDEIQRIKSAGTGANNACSLDELFSETETEYKWLVPNRIPAGKLMLIAGPSKRGKTTAVVQSYIELLYSGTMLGHSGEPFPFVYLDFENDTPYVKSMIIEPAMKGRDWTLLKEWFRMSNRQVTSTQRKLPEYITADYLRSLLAQYDRPTFVLIDSLRRAFGRTPGLKDNWEWSASAISSLLDPLGELSHLSGHTLSVIHHHNNDGRASGSTDLIAAPDVILDFQVVKSQSGLETNDRRIKLSGRLPASSPLLLTFEDGVYRYLGEGDEGASVKDEELSVAMMTRMVALVDEKGPLSGTEMIEALRPKNKNQLYKCANILKDQDVFCYQKKKYQLTPDYTSAWRKFQVKLGIKLPSTQSTSVSGEPYVPLAGNVA